MLRASALFYAVTVSVLIAMVTGSMMLLVHYRNLETERWLAREHSASNARSAVRWAMATSDGSSTRPEAFDLFGRGQDSVLVQTVPYGLLDRIATRAWVADQQTDIAAFTGGRANEGNVLLLGIGDVKLNLCGDARIRGDAVIPNADVGRGYIEGRAFSGVRLVEGTVSKANGSIAGIAADKLLRMKRYCSRERSADEEVVTMNRAEVQNANTEVFDATPVVEMGMSGRLSGISLKGPLIIRSEDTLVVASDCELDMVILEAPYIVIEAGASLTVQCFAETGIHVDEHVKLLYPSVLALVAKSDAEDVASIDLGADAELEGTAVAMRTTTGDDPAVGVMIAPGALVLGEVYAQGLVQHQGTIRGRLYADGLILRTASSTYRGYLLDGVIEGFEDPYRTDWLGLDAEEHKDVIEWTRARYRPKAD